MTWKPGDLVTFAYAPEGAPTWLGAVVDDTGHLWCRKLGQPGAHPVAKASVRPLSDVEAAQLTAVLCVAEWKEGVGAYKGQARLLSHDGVEYARACPDGLIGWVVQGGRFWQLVEEYGTGNVPGMPRLVALASRALLRWMCEGLRGVDETRVP